MNYDDRLDRYEEECEASNKEFENAKPKKLNWTEEMKQNLAKAMAGSFRHNRGE